MYQSHSSVGINLHQVGLLVWLKKLQMRKCEFTQKNRGLFCQT